MQLFAASTDDLETQTKFAKELGVDYPIIADSEKKAATAMGVLMPVGFASRKTVIIGKDGKLLAIEDKVDVKNAGEQLAKKLAELKIEKRKPAAAEGEKADGASEERPTSRPSGG